jgi:hypothetical protein
MPVLERLRCHDQGLEVVEIVASLRRPDAGVRYRRERGMPRGFSGHSPETVDAWFPIEEAMRGGWDNPFRNAVPIVARPYLAAPPS